MPTAAARELPIEGQHVAGRYRIERTLGRGGTATVYSAIDEETGARVALKFLLADSPAGEHVALFQREYHTLAQITHPSVIRVLDYGVTEAGPFYTMELLDGRDLHELAPLPWKDACRVLREVASALAILHSRRLVHRDVSHRNVRVTTDGRAKLIDFGAMTPMGFVATVIGTPPFLSPEAAYREPLDQRADLYALGALGYWLLTARHPYPARKVRELPEIWARGSPPPPSSLVPHLPKTLDQLLMALLQHDAMARPSSAAEVIDRLSAIAELPAADELSIAHSYLAHPKLIGRQRELDQLKEHLDRALPGHGGVLAIQGSSGTGRSRLLQEAVIHAKLSGATVLQVSARGAGKEAFAVARKLLEELLQKMPRVAKAHSPARAVALGWLLPALQRSDPGPVELPENTQELHARIQEELARWVLERSARDRLLFAIDDLEACDEESLGVLIAVSGEGARGPAILVTLREAELQHAPGARLLASRALRRLDLRPLSASDTERLVESLFGSSPNSRRVAGWMHERAQGNPLECLELARHLVERRAAYQLDGAWMLPHELPAGLPRGLAEASRARVAALDPDARSLAEIIALYGRSAPLALCIALADVRDTALLFRSLNQLVSAEIVTARGDEYACSREGLREALLRGLSDERRRTLHQRIGTVLVARGPSTAPAKVEAGYHLMRGRERLAGVALIEQAVISQQALSAVGDVVIPALELALQVCEREDASKARSMRFRALLVACAFLYDEKLLSYADPLLEQLHSDCGLGLWPSLDPALGKERLTRMLQLAQDKYDRTPVERRGLPPLEALVRFSQVVGSTLGVAIFGYDQPTVARLAELVAPLGELDKSSSVAAVTDLVTVVHEALLGHSNRSTGLRVELIARLRDPRMYVGLNEDGRKSILATQLHALGMRLVAQQVTRALQIADEIDALGLKMYAGAALQIRLLAHLYGGDAQAAKECQVRLEALSLQRGPGRQTEVWLLAYLIDPYALWGDVIALKRSAERLASLVPHHPAYRSYLYTALGAYRRERGQLAQARSALQRALQLMVDASHPWWMTTMSQYIETLVAADECARARDLAYEHFGQPDDELIEREVTMRQLLPVLALAEARLGAVDAAAAKLDAGIAQAASDDVPLVLRARLHEARARVAIHARDAAAFAHHARLAADLQRSTKNSVLMLKHFALLDEAARAGMTKTAELLERADLSIPTVADRPGETDHGDVESFDRAIADLLDEP
jgi:serine/threonine-protein kinase